MRAKGRAAEPPDATAQRRWNAIGVDAVNPRSGAGQGNPPVLVRHAKP